MNYKIWVLIFIVLSLSVYAGAKEVDMPVIKIYYDNTSVNKEIKPEWGFSALIKHKDRNILFDTGGNPDILSANMKKMNSDPNWIEFVVVSHEHWDHIGGLPAVLKANQKVYLLKSFSHNLKGQVKASKAKLVEVLGFQEIVPGVYTTGEMGEAIKEQALIVDTDKGLIIVTGCSHPGIVEIAHRSKELLKKDVFFVIGGFHLKDRSAQQVKNIVEELKVLGVKKIAPCHCTDEMAIAIFQKEFGNDFVKVGAGSVVDTLLF